MATCYSTEDDAAGGLAGLVALAGERPTRRLPAISGALKLDLDRGDRGAWFLLVLSDPGEHPYHQAADD